MVKLTYRPIRFFVRHLADKKGRPATVITIRAFCNEQKEYTDVGTSEMIGGWLTPVQAEREFKIARKRFKLTELGQLLAA